MKILILKFGVDWNHSLGQISALIEHQDRLYERKNELKTLLKALPAASSGSPVASSGGSSAIENWSEPFEWDSRADDVRFNIFGISNYRANQKEVSMNYTFPKSKMLLTHVDSCLKKLV